MAQRTTGGVTTQHGDLDTSNARKVGLDAEALGPLMAMLSNQYANKHRAVLREYFCNGWDSHIDSGNTSQPVLVTLPSDLQPSLLIQDFGLGLAEADMVETFGTYLKSTKRKDSETTGGFGIGSKSAWTMGQQFIVTGVKDGTKTEALFSLDSNGIGEVTIIRSLPTEEPNGVLISLSVPDVESMHEAAADFFETVDRGTVLVDGQEPTPIFESLTHINDQTYVRPNHTGQIFIVMGQVCYAIDREVFRAVSRKLGNTPHETLAKHLSRWDSTTSVYFRVPIDSVTPHPSRERLRDTGLTINCVASLVTGLSQDLSDAVKNDVDAAPSYYAATLLADEKIKALDAFKISRKSLTYRGLPIRKTANIRLARAYMGKRNYNRAALSVLTQDHSAPDVEPYTLDVDQTGDSILVVTQIPAGRQGSVTRYLKRYMEETGTRQVFMTSEIWGSHDWFGFGIENGARTLTFEEFRAEVKTLPSTSALTRSEPSYTVGWHERAQRDLSTRELLTDILGWGKDIVVFRDQSNMDKFAQGVLDADYTPVVLLGQQSRAALRKRVDADGSVKIFDGNVDDLVKAEAVKQFKVTDEEREALSARAWLGRNVGSYWRSTTVWAEEWVEHFGVAYTGTLLQRVIDSVDLAKITAEGISDTRVAEIKALAKWVGEQQIPAYDDTFSDYKESFPLLTDDPTDYWSRRRGQAYRDEVIAYINSKG